MDPLTRRPASPATLEVADRIGILGDLHGDLEHLVVVSRTMEARGIHVLLQLGDFGFIWPDTNWGHALDKIENRLRKAGQVLYFVDGNHEDFTTLNGFPISADGLRHVRPSIIHIPRGWRTTLAHGRTFAAMGGANSIDRGLREEGVSWWPEESITEADLERLGTEPVDILVGHDAPAPWPKLDKRLGQSPTWWSEEDQHYADDGRQMLTRAFTAVQPKHFFGGHFHRYLADSVTFADGFTTTMVTLDMNGLGRSFGQGILDLPAFEFEPFDRDDVGESSAERESLPLTFTAEPLVTEPRYQRRERLSDEDSGTWLVTIRDSRWLFDLDARRVTRFPDEGALQLPIDRSPRLLGRIFELAVGYPGQWRLMDEIGAMDRLTSSTVLAIVRAGIHDADDGDFAIPQSHEARSDRARDGHLTETRDAAQTGDAGDVPG